MDAAAIDIDEVLETLRRRGAKITTARRAVLEEFARTEGLHLSAEDLGARVQARYPEVHISTVYRTVDFLEREGIVTRVHVNNGPSAFHFVTNAHHHAVCTHCGTEIELPVTVFRPVANKLLTDHGFVADPSHLTITGTCATCAARPS
jgi:Fur family transcriptional regulator, ferric uptake regulator